MKTHRTTLLQQPVFWLSMLLLFLFPALAGAQGPPTLQWLYAPIRNMNHVAYSPDGVTLALAGNVTYSNAAGIIELLNTSTGAITTLNTRANYGGSVTSAVFSPDGKTVGVGGYYPTASNQNQGVVELWDVSTAKVIYSLPTGSSKTYSVAFSPDGKTLADGGVGPNGGVVELWNVATGTLISSLPTTASSGIQSVVFSPDDKTLADGGMGNNVGVVELWNVATGNLISSLPTTAGKGVYSVAFSPNGKTLADGGNGTNSQDVLELWSVSTDKLTRTLTSASVAHIYSICFSLDGTTLIDGGDGAAGGILQLWTIASGKLSSSLSTATESVVSIALSPDGNTLLDAGSYVVNYHSLPYLLEAWNLKTSSLITNYSSPQEANVSSVAISPDGTLLAVAGTQFLNMSSATDSQPTGLLQIWSLPDGILLSSFVTAATNLRAVSFSPDGKTLADGGYQTNDGYNTGIVELWDISTGQLIDSLPTSASGSMGIFSVPGVYSVAFSPDGKTLADCGYSDASFSTQGVLELWTVSTGKLSYSLPTTASALDTVAFSPDSKSVADGGDGVLEMWSVATGKQNNSFATNLYLISTIAFSPDGTTLAAGGLNELGDDNDGGVEIWTPANSKRLVQLDSGDSVDTIAFTPDGATLLVGVLLSGNDQTSLQAFSTTDYSLESYYDQLTASMESLVLVAHSPFLAYGCSDGTVVVAQNPFFVPPTLKKLTLSSNSVVGGNTVTGTVTLSGPAPTGGSVITLSSNLPALVMPPTSVTILQGATTSAPFTISTVTTSKSATATLTATYGKSHATAKLTVQASVSALQGITINPTSVLGSRDAVGAVTLTAPAPSGGVSVTLTSNNTGAATVPASVTVPAGASSKTFLIQTSTVTTATKVTITAAHSGISKTATLNVQPITLVGLTLNPDSVEGGLDSTLAITLNGPAPSGGVTVTLKSSNTTVVSIPTSVVIPAGTTSLSIPVSTSLVNANTTVTITATYGEVNLTATLNLTP